MKSSVFGCLAGLMIMVLVSGSASHAQEANKPLTIGDLKEKFNQLGYDFKENKDKDGNLVSYNVVVPRDGRNWTLVVSLSGNKEWLYVTAYGAKHKSPTVPPMIMEKMLELNDTIGPASFAYYKPGSMFFFQTPMLNLGGITNRVLKDRLEATATLLGKYEDLWNPEKWPAE